MIKIKPVCRRRLYAIDSAAQQPDCILCFCQLSVTVRALVCHEASPDLYERKTVFRQSTHVGHCPGNTQIERFTHIFPPRKLLCPSVNSPDIRYPELCTKIIYYPDALVQRIDEHELLLRKNDRQRHARESAAGPHIYDRLRTPKLMVTRTQKRICIMLPDKFRPVSYSRQVYMLIQLQYPVHISLEPLHALCDPGLVNTGDQCVEYVSDFVNAHFYRFSFSSFPCK